MTRALRGAAAALALCATGASAADIGLYSEDGLDLITVEGEFKAGDEAAFKRKLLETDARGILFASPGGALLVGIEIGKVARWQGLATIVPEGSICASACALAWLGGTQRFMGEGSRIGFHAAYKVDDGGKAQETGSGNALVGSYVSNLGLSEEAIVYITQSAPDQMQWLTVQDAMALGIAVRPLGQGDPGENAPPAPQPEPEPASPAPGPGADERRTPPPPEPVAPQAQVCRVDDVRPPDDWLAMRTEPSAKRGRQLRRLRRGQEFELVGDTRGNWYRIRLPDGETGWVSWEVSRWIAC